MTTFIQFAVLGVGSGALYALLACGLVVIYRGAGILNLAYGAYAMVGAFSFYQLRDIWSLPFAVAFPVAVLFVAALGGLTNVLVMRPLRNAAGIIRLIATLGILSVLEGAVLVIKGPGVFIVPTFLSGRVFRVGKITIPESMIILLVIAVAAIVAFDRLSRHTRFGLATLAVSENERGAAALGWSPNTVATVTWSAGCGLAAAAGILIAPSLGLQATSLTLIMVAAMAAAILGDFSAFYPTLLGGLVIGIAQSEASRSSVAGIGDAVPFAATLLVLLIRGSRLPIRGNVITKLPKLSSGVPRYRVIAVATGIFVVLMFVWFPAGLNNGVALQAATGMVLLSVVVLTGFAGQLSLGQFALAGFGALFAGRVAQEANLPFELALLAGLLGATLVGGIVAFPALRTRGVSLAVLTLGLGLAVDQLVFSNQTLIGGLGGTPVGNPIFFGWNISYVSYPVRYGVVSVAFLVAATLVVANVRRGRAGRRLVAIRTNERAAAALGISVLESKIFAFMLSSGIAGLGGVFIGFEGPSVVYNGFDPLTSINTMGYAVVGGIGYATGPIMGSSLAPGTVAPYFLSRFSSFDYWLILIGGLVTLQILLMNPDGYVAAVSQFLGKKLKPRQDAAAARRSERVAHRAIGTTLDSGAETVERPAEAMLELRQVSVAFRGVVVLDQLDLVVRSGEVVGLIGPNGAGKTTAIDSITGYVTPKSGTILYNGVDITGLPVHRRSRAGISRSFQSLELFEDLSVYENLQAASDRRDRLAYVSGLLGDRTSALSSTAKAAVRELKLEDVLSALPTSLPYGQRRLVAIARALATRPSILLLDEPAAGLDTVESRELSSLIRHLAAQWGIGVLLVEHDMSVIMNSCDRVAVIDFGHKIAEGTPDEVQSDPAVVAAYLGHHQERSTVASKTEAQVAT